MITKNFKNFTATLLYAFGSNRALSGKGLFPFKDKNGNTYYLVARFDGIYPAVISEGLVDSSNDYGYCVGSSDAAESEDAYNLSSPILSGLQIDTVYAGPNYNTTKQRMEYSRTIKLANTSQSAITIREVGIFQPVRYANSRNAQGDESLTKAMLIDRTVLSTPLTIQPGTTHGVKYSVAAMVQ